MLNMQDEERLFAVCLWSNLCENGLAAPGDAQRLTDHNLSQRVCRIVGRDGRFERIKYGDLNFAISPTCLKQVDNVAYEVGDRVLFKYGLARIREIIWHFKDKRPNYYLEKDGRKLSKRYYDEDLSPASTPLSGSRR